MSKIKLYIKIFTTFLKISAFTFGGGYASLPFIKEEIVNKNKWMTEEEVTDAFTMSQIVPGIIYVSLSSFIGYRLAGVLGAVFASIAVLIPSGIAIMTLFLFLRNIMDNEIAKKVFSGIIVGVASLTSVVLIDLLKKSVRTAGAILTFIVTILLLEVIKVKVFIIVLGGLALSIIYSTIQMKKAGNKQDA